MTTELFVLTLTSVLLASLWIPYIVGVNMQKGDSSGAFDRPADLREMPAWVHRAHRAHLNLLEQFAPFAALVILAHVLGVSNAITGWSVVAFLSVRVVHAVGMISGVAKFPARPMIFLIGWMSILVLAWQVLANG